LRPCTIGVCAAQFSPVDDNLLALAAFDGTIRLFDSETGRELWNVRYHDRHPLSLAFTPDGKSIATGGEEGTIAIWNVAGGKRRLTMTGHEHMVYAVASSPDGRTLASGSNDQTAALWDLTTGERRHTLRGFHLVNGVAFSPDGKTVATVGTYDKLIRLWETATGKERLRIPHDLGPLALAFTPDGRTLVTGAQVNNTAYLWDADTGQELKRLSGHRKIIYGLAISPDGDRLATASYDKTVLVWDVKAVTKRPALTTKLDGRALKTLWADLAGTDAERAYRAVCSLTLDPEQTLPFIGAHLRPAAPPPPLARLIADLDAEEFDVRETASRALEQLGAVAAPGLREALQQAKLSPEARQRIRLVLDRVAASPVPVASLRPLRTIEVLERIGSEDARRLLEKLTAKEYTADVVVEAKASLARLKRVSTRP
jgi:sugar lactone lactonase YvrE